MLVDVVRMRSSGARLSREAIRRAVPTRGNLQLTVQGMRGKNPPLLAGVVVPGTSSWAVPALDNAVVRKIMGDNLLIVGVEEVQHGRQWNSHEQVWWCRLVHPAPPAAPADLADAEDEIAALRLGGYVTAL